MVKRERLKRYGEEEGGVFEEDEFALLADELGEVEEEDVEAEEREDGEGGGPAPEEMCGSVAAG